ncbi:23S rRNA pseudouridine1911/1915/1917 synthase [Nitrosomonas sp. Nm51]|uniref:23S rRNA pseudouridine(1911/1915/1917) synthase RluD n=1 Tax=Nitrosomonas sp. Nm51 TaxID=133720 RepID=UPI0008AC69EE|nr:23S rRNA pseudouridine(1911/1915/1917) synthase RluD [Nitrosomonas sp. Nm51]SEQ78676.1 23S rRNA pseudouridine1911/1915/1917 synthase [Nitrosomonas sp. Nm51]
MKTDDDYNVNPLSASWGEDGESCIHLQIPVDCAGLRLDQALSRQLPGWSRNRIQTWIAQARVKLDNQSCTAKQKVWGNEHIRVYPYFNEPPSVHGPEAIALNIIHEDNTMIVVNKPAGMVVHPGNGNRQGTLLNALLHHAPQLENVPRAGIVHRLDKDTSGLLVVAKTVETQIRLVRQLQQRTMKREYLALVLGQVNQAGTVDAPIGRHPTHRTKMAVTSRGKPARTHFKPIESLTGCSLLQCSLETGRTHQIRVHMHSIHHSLVGDPVYGGKPKKTIAEIGRLLAEFPRQALHAWQLALTHPENAQTVHWQAELPDDLTTLLNQLRRCRRGCNIPLDPC